MLMVEIIIIILWIFFGNIIVLTTGDDIYKYIKIHCYNINETTVESNTENETYCFGLDLNIGGAMGQAGGVLAFGWINVSILTWITLYISHTCTCPCNFTKNKKFRACCKCGIVIIIFLLAASFLIGALSMTFFKWIPFTMQNYLQFGVFAAITISACLHCTNVDKMTPSLEKSCSETVMERIGDLEKWQKEERNKLLLKIKKYLSEETSEEEQEDDKEQVKKKKRRRRGNKPNERTKLIEESQSDEEEEQLSSESDLEKREKELKKQSQDKWNEIISNENKRFELRKEKFNLQENGEEELKTLQDDKRKYQREDKEAIKEIKKIRKKKIKIKDKKMKNLQKKSKCCCSLDEERISSGTEWAKAEKKRLKLEEERIKLSKIELLREIAEQECKRAIAREASFYLTETEMRDITEAAFFKVMRDLEKNDNENDPKRANGASVVLS